MIEIKNLSSVKLNEKKLFQFSEQIINKNYQVEVVFIDRNEIKKLNHEYRNLDQETDILTFTDEKKGSLHQIIICPEVAKTNSHLSNNNLEKEVELLIFHGWQHIIGNHHA